MKKVSKLRLALILVISLLVIITGAIFATKAFQNGDLAGGIIGICIATIILIFAVLVVIRGNKDIKEGFPVQDERSKMVLQKASSKAFYVSLYLLLLVGFLSEDIINFRDVSQATSMSVGLMAALFGIFWLYYNRK